MNRTISYFQKKKFYQNFLYAEDLPTLSIFQLLTSFPSQQNFTKNTGFVDKKAY